MTLRGNPVSGGVAVGKAYRYQPFTATVQEQFCDQAEAQQQLDRYRQVRRQAAAELAAIRDQLERNDPKKAKIFTAHLDILEDVAIQEEIEEGIQEEHWTGDWAIHKIYGKFVRMLRKAPDPLIQERAMDLQDVCTRLLRIWCGAEERNLSTLTGPVVVVAGDLLPSDTATLDRNNVLAILTATGGPTSHSAIIAKSYEIPAVLGIPGLMDQVQDGQLLAVNALTGQIIPDPDEAQITAHRALQEQHLARAGRTKRYLTTPPLTADGTRIDIGLNIGSASKEELQGEAYSDFVGLFRTEFLYMGRSQLPGEEEQYHIYRQVLEAFGERPVTLRTLDIGGDKTTDCLPLPHEDNPFLGNRALRLCFSMPDLFRVQLRAALRASAHGRLWLMLPMVADLDDIRRAKAMIESVKEELAAEGLAFDPAIKVGIMIEIPSIALIAHLAAAEVDFGSIGTNDLCQYLMAVDRMNPQVAGYYQCYHPALLQVLDKVAQAFQQAGKPLSVCGEMAGDPLAASLLAGLGLRKLSMGMASIAPVKEQLAALTLAEMEQMARSALELSTAAEVRSHLLRQTGRE